jgi:DNA-binding response OmpR family regulator
MLAREHGFRAVSLESLPEEFQKALETTENWRPSQKPSLILLEDDEDAITIAKLALEKEYAIDIARNGSDGLKLWKQKRHNLVLLDYMLPGMKGNEVLTEIMAIDNNQPVIVMTAYDKPELNKDFILNGASQYLPKPFTLTELRMHCRMVLNKSNLIYQSCYHEMIFKKLTKQIFELDSCIRQNNLKKAQAVIGDIRQELALQLSEDDLINFDSVSV